MQERRNEHSKYRVKSDMRSSCVKEYQEINGEIDQDEVDKV